MLSDLVAQIEAALLAATPGKWVPLLAHSSFYMSCDETDAKVDGYWVRIPPPGSLGDYESQGYTKDDAHLLGRYGKTPSAGRRVSGWDTTRGLKLLPRHGGSGSKTSASSAAASPSWPGCWGTDDE